MSQKIVMEMPGVDLANPRAIDQIQKIKGRLEVLGWYLQAKAIDDFFSQFPDLKSMNIENVGNGPTPKIVFFEEEWVEGYRYELPAEERKALDLALEELDRKFTELVVDGETLSLMGLERHRYIEAGKVFDTFGRLWRNGQDNPLEQWTALLAEVEQAKLEHLVEPAQAAKGKSVNRM